MHLLQSAFLPQGYPESVSKDYLEYQVWDTIQVSYSMNTVLSSLLGILDLPYLKFKAKMGARFVIESMHGMLDAEKSNEDYGIEQKFESE